MNRLQMIEAVFKRLDTDRSGDIDRDEIERFFKKTAGDSQSERSKTADSLVEYFDQDGDGCIDLNEFKSGIKRLERGEGADFLRAKLAIFFENERTDPADGELKTFTVFVKEYGSKSKAQVRTRVR